MSSLVLFFFTIIGLLLGFFCMIELDQAALGMGVLAVSGIVFLVALVVNHNEHIKRR
jgi:hypothetical protein